MAEFKLRDGNIHYVRPEYAAALGRKVVVEAEQDGETKRHVLYELNEYALAYRGRDERVDVAPRANAEGGMVLFGEGDAVPCEDVFYAKYEVGKMALDDYLWARAYLLRCAPAGATVYTVMSHRARSGMTRSIKPLAVVTTERTDAAGNRVFRQEIADLTWAAARVLGWAFDKDRGGVKVVGAGMDMGFHLVYTLAQHLHGDGYALSCEWV